MTVQPTRDQLRALANAATEGPWSYADYGDPNPEHWPVGLIETDDGEEAWTCDTALAMSEPDAKFIAAARTALPQLLDQLDQAEHRIARLEAQSDIRGRAVVMYRDRAREAEAERDWNIRSSRLAKEERIKANARAAQAEARVRHLEGTARVLVREVIAAEDARDEHRRGKAAAEARIRDLTQEVRDERGAALDALEQIKVRDARIKAVEDALSYADMGETLVTRSRIRRALEGDA